MRQLRAIQLCIALMLAASTALAQDEVATPVTITVNSSVIKNHITPYMTGSCIEDVNHEIYGGLYAQRIFGESFEEPPTPSSPIKGWTAYGGRWRLDGNILQVDSDAGAKLVDDAALVPDGTVSCELKQRGGAGSNAAILVRVTDPHTGADNWNGYEISVSSNDGVVAIHRHHHNWHLLKSAKADLPAGGWYRITVEMRGPTMRVFLGDSNAPAVEYTDTADPLLTGSIGLRTWNSVASFRNLTVHWDTGRGGQLPFRPVESAGSGVSGMWDPIRTGGAQAQFAWESTNPYNSLYCQKVQLIGQPASGRTLGVANAGLNRWGIAFRKGQRFSGSVCLRTQQGSLPVTVALQSADGTKTYASQTIAAAGKEWKRFNFSLSSRATDPKGRFAIWIAQPEAVWIDQVTLMPTGDDLFHGQPIRADIAQSIQRGGIRFLRYGGSMVNAPTYKFKAMLGDRDKRPQANGTWYAHSTNGFGIEEFVQFCRTAGIEPAFAINIDETAQDAADMVEYFNGPATSVWGKKRAKNGHPAPYGVRYIEIGNEEAIDGNKDWYRRYLARFLALEPEIHAKDAALQLVIAAWWRPNEPLCREIAEALNGKAALWDVHVGGDGLQDGAEVDRVMTEMEAKLQDWTPGAFYKACIFEENGGRHDMQRALGHAHILNVSERHGDFVLMDCPANCLQPWMQNDNGWDQGQIFFTPDKVWGMPPYYAQQMAADNHLPLRVDAKVEGAANDLDVTATRSADGKMVVVKIVNVGASGCKATVLLDGFQNSKASTWTLAGDLTAFNPPNAPERIKPVEGQVDVKSNRVVLSLPAHSYIVLRVTQPLPQK